MNLLSRAGLLDTSFDGDHSNRRWYPEELMQATEMPAEDAIVTAEDILAAEIDHQAIELERVAAAEAEVERRINEAFESGYEEGRLEGEIAEGVRLRNAIAAAESALDEIRENEMLWQGAVRPNIAALAISIARSIIGRELQADADTVADLVRKALAEFPIDQPMRIRINPHDLSLISACDPHNGTPPVIAPNRDIRWLADPRMEPGGCLVEGREQIVDGRIDTALERVYRRITYTHV